MNMTPKVSVVLSQYIAFLLPRLFQKFHYFVAQAQAKKRTGHEKMIQLRDITMLNLALVIQHTAV